MELNSSQSFKVTVLHLIKMFPSFLYSLCPMWVQSGIFISLIIVLNLNISFNFCAMLGFNVIWFVKCMKIRKLKIEIISMQHNSFIDSIHCRVSPLSYTRSTKLFALNLVLPHSLNFFIVTKRISDWHHFCKRKFL